MMCSEMWALLALLFKTSQLFLTQRIMTLFYLVWKCFWALRTLYSNGYSHIC